MHKQNKSDREVGLENIMESMYTAAAHKTVTCDKCNGEGCDHCDGTGKHTVKEARPYIDWSKHGGDKVKDEKCPKCGEVHTINAGCSKVHEAGASDHVPPHDADKLACQREGL